MDGSIKLNQVANPIKATMQKTRNQDGFFLASLLLLFSLLTICSTQEFGYNQGSGTGPQNWGDLKPEWRTCGEGRQQSPIDIPGDAALIVEDAGAIEKRYKPAQAVLKNRGHDAQVEWRGDAGDIVVDGTSFKLQQRHWHTTSEHTENGQRFAMELHMVHASSSGQIAVVAETYQLGQANAVLEKVLDQISSVAVGEEIDFGVVDANDVDNWETEYYRYTGSLTTPPCTEGVIWTISKQVKTVSQAQVDAYKSAIREGEFGNARPSQPLNGRSVELHVPSSN